MLGVYGGRYNLFPLGNFFARNITLKMGQCPAQRYVRPILELIKQGKFDATDIITHRLTLSEGEHAYTIFDRKEDNCIKVVLKPYGHSKKAGKAFAFPAFLHKIWIF